MNISQIGNGCLTRRSWMALLAGVIGSAESAFPQDPSRPIGITDWNLHLGANPRAVEKAASLGFRGVQVSFGRKLVDGKMPVDSPEVVARYLALSTQHGVTIDGTCVDRLHDNGLKSDPLALRWISDSIRLTRELKAKVLLLPFFDRWALTTQSEMAHVADALREVAPEAEKAGVLLGIEDTISAEDNVRIMERSQSQSVLVYYDIGNSTKAGFDVVQEIRWLGKARLCQVHFKDNPHLLGQGAIDIPAVASALKAINWSGWINLETDARESHLEEDLRANLNYTNRILQQA